MKIVLDNTKEIEVGSFTETMDEFGKNLHAINLVSVNDQTQFPTVPQLNDLGFTTIKVINDNQVEIPLQYQYTKVDNINISYDDESKNYVISYSIN